MLCLGVESSCDDTALALVRDNVLLRALTADQNDVHTLFGGVVPELASREHYRRIGPLYDALLSAQPEAARPDVIAISRGPGLLGSLLVGLAFAKGLALATGAKLIGVNHLHAHLLAAGLERDLIFPSLGLLISGGHTHICRMDSPSAITVIGRTLDDAAGEAFDKIAKMLGGPYPGGRFIEELGRGGEIDPTMFAKPYLNNDNLDFSFSGLKTAAATYLTAHPHLKEDARRPAEEATPALRSFCASLSWCIAQTLIAKLVRALEKEHAAGRKVDALTVAGGVAANSVIRELTRKTAEAMGLPLILPSLPLCADNAAMVAYSGGLLAAEGLHHDLSLSAVARGRAIPNDALGLRAQGEEEYIPRRSSSC